VQLLWLEKKYDVLMIKLFDRIHNMQTIGAKSPEKIKKIVDETIKSFIWITEYLDNLKVQQQIVQLCKQQLGDFSQPLMNIQENVLFTTNTQLLSLIFQNNEYYNRITLLKERQ